MPQHQRKCYQGAHASKRRCTTALQLVVSLLLQHAVSAQRMIAVPVAAAAPLQPGTVVTTTTTTTKVTEITEEEITTPAPAPPGQAAPGVPAVTGGGAAGQQPNWVPTVTRSPSPSPVGVQPSPSPAPSSSNSSISNGTETGTGRTKYSTLTETASVDEQEAPVAAAAAAVPSSPKPAAAALKAAGPAPAAAAAGVKPAAANVTARIWRPVYPFPQCVNTTLTYDVSFVGPLRYAQVGTVKFAYHRFGPLQPGKTTQAPTVLSRDTKPSSPVVFISGWGTAMYMWPIPLLQRLAETREVIIFDNMRTGFSTDSSKEPLSIPLMANTTAAFIRTLGLQKPDIFGWSLGGMVAYALLALHYTKIGNVIVVAASPGGPDGLLPPTPVTQLILAVQQNYTALLPYLFPSGAKDPGVCSFYAAYNSFYNTINTRLATPLGQNSLIEQSQAVVKFFQDPSIINRLQPTANRVLILHGVQDQLMPIKNSLLGVYKLLGAWMLQFPGEGHGLPFSQLQGVIIMTMQFFNFANPLSTSDLQKWANYGDTSATRGTSTDTTLVVKAEAVKGSG